MQQQNSMEAESHMRSITGLRRQMQFQRERIVERMDNTPNLRDFGFDHRAEFEVALNAYHAETDAMEAELQRLGQQVAALRQAGLSQGMVAQ